MRRLLLVALLLALAAGAARADAFADANRDYAAQSYEAAIAKYEQLERSGLRHEDLYYNLGNAYIRLAQEGQPDRVGRAILAYERALRLRPGFADARYNLEVARELSAAHAPRDQLVDADALPLWMRIVTYVPQPTLAWLLLGLDALFFAVLILVRFLPTGLLRTGLLVGNVFTGLATVSVAALLAGQLYFGAKVHIGVIVVDEVVMREGPDVTRRAGPTLHAGHRAVLRQSTPRWVLIELANGVQDWVPREAFDEI